MDKARAHWCVCGGLPGCPRLPSKHRQMGAMSRVGECVGCDLPAGEKNIFTAVGGCVCTRLPSAATSPGGGAAVHTLPVLGCPNPTGHIPGNHIPSLPQRMKQDRGVSSSPSAPKHVGAHRGRWGMSPILPRMLPPASAPAPPPQTTPVFPKQGCAEGRVVLSPTGGELGGTSRISSAIWLLGWACADPQTLGSSGFPHTLPRAGMLTEPQHPTQLKPRTARGAVPGALPFLHARGWPQLEITLAWQDLGWLGQGWSWLCPRCPGLCVPVAHGDTRQGAQHSPHPVPSHPSQPQTQTWAVGGQPPLGLAHPCGQYKVPVGDCRLDWPHPASPLGSSRARPLCAAPPSAPRIKSPGALPLPVHQPAGVEWGSPTPRRRGKGVRPCRLLFVPPAPSRPPPRLG